jgi:argininosuccinate lyase
MHNKSFLKAAACLLKQTRFAKAIKRWNYNRSALDYSQITDVEVQGIDFRDSPDFCDAYIASASYKGRDMTEAELDRLNADSDFVYEAVQRKLY